MQDEFTTALQKHIQNSSRVRKNENGVGLEKNVEPKERKTMNNFVQNGIARTVNQMANNVQALAKEELSNGVANTIERNVNGVGKIRDKAINGAVNGINSISKQVQDHTERGVKAAENGVARISNGIANNAKQLAVNGGNSIQNGVANGIGHIVNGHLPTNKVAPVRNTLPNNNAVDPIRNMYNEVESYQHNLHI